MCVYSVLLGVINSACIVCLLHSSGSSENDQNFTFCGSWHHGNKSLTLNYNLSPGCKNMNVSANDSSLSVVGQITSQCTQSKSMPLKLNLVALSTVCVYWEPSKDYLWVKVCEATLEPMMCDIIRNDCLYLLIPDDQTSVEKIINVSFRIIFVYYDSQNK